MTRESMLALVSATMATAVLAGLILLAVGVSALLIVWLMRARDRWTATALALVIAGALGNAIDRVALGAVFDFIDLHWNRWHWPAFNVADSAITIGVAVLLLHALIFSSPTEDARKTPRRAVRRAVRRPGRRPAGRQPRQ